MKTNHAFWRSVHSLSHPVTIGAVLILLLNDHLLRYISPSWLTGKLGDFTWLIFAPLICALVVAWIVPRRIRQHERVVGLVAFTFIGLWFALAKIVPSVHELTLDALEAIIGWRGTLRLDVTDLLTLPALLIGWQVWTRADNTPLHLPSRVWWVAGLGIVATLATSQPPPPPDYLPDGIKDICAYQGELFIYQFRDDYNFRVEKQFKNFQIAATSRDGGLSWNVKFEPGDFQRFNALDSLRCSNSGQPLIDPDNPDIHYRWNAGENIQQSIDAGQTWNVIHTLPELDQDVREHYRSIEGHVSYYDSIKPGPLGGVVDRATDNVVFPMGWNGVLVLTPDNQWHWVTIDSYYLPEMRLENVLDVLFAELCAAIALTLLMIAHSAMRLGDQRLTFGNAFTATMLVLSWLLWLGLVVFLNPMSHERSLMGDFPQQFALIWFLPFILITFASAIKNFTKNASGFMSPIIITAVGTGIAYFFPFILWAFGRIPHYGSAMLAMIILTGTAIISGQVYLMRTIPNPNKKKKVVEADPDAESPFVDEAL